VETLFGNLSKIKVERERLDRKLNKLVGSFIGTIYTSEEDHWSRRICIDMRNHVSPYCKFNKKQKINPPTNKDNQQNDQEIQPLDPNNNNSNSEPSYPKDELLRDLFLWSIFMDMPEMGKIILVHLQSRICAALIASAIFKRYAKLSTTVDHKEKFHNQALEFETYAAQFIDKCYEYNERLACELLLREIPLFGHVSCIQVVLNLISNCTI
jgi:hypothetical protein